MESAMAFSLLSSSSHSFIHPSIPLSLHHFFAHFLIPVLPPSTANSTPCSRTSSPLPSAKSLSTCSLQHSHPALTHQHMRQSPSLTSLPDTSISKSVCLSNCALSTSDSSALSNSRSTNSASSRSCSSSPSLPSVSLMSRKATQEPNDHHIKDQTLSTSPRSSSTRLAPAFSTPTTFIPQANVRQVPSIVDLSLSTSITSQQMSHESADSNPAIPTASRQQLRDTTPTVSISKSSTSLPGAKPLQFINNLAPVIPRSKPTPNSLYIQTQSAVQQKIRKQLREEGKIKRSSNCFIMYRTHIHPLLVARYGNQNNKEISRLAGRCWRSEPESVKSVYRQQAHEEKLKHASLYPAYKYTPARSGPSSSSSSSSATKDKENARASLVSTAKNDEEEARLPESSSDSLSKQAATNHSLRKDRERNPDLVLLTDTSASAAASSNEQERGKKKRPNPDQSSSTSKKFHVTETALHNFTGDTVPELPVAKKPKVARFKQSVTIPGQGSATVPVSIAGALSNTFGYDFSFPPSVDTSLSLDMDSSGSCNPQSLSSIAGWDAETMSASLAFNPLFLNGTIDSNDVWSPAQTSSPGLTTPLLDLPLSAADYPWLQSPPLTTPTLELSSPLFSTAASGSVTQPMMSSFPASCNHLNSVVTQNVRDVSSSSAWGLESMSALSSVPMSFGQVPSTTGVISGVPNGHVQSQLSAQLQLSSVVNGNWIPRTPERVLPATGLPFHQQSWLTSPLSSLPSSTPYSLSNTEHSTSSGSSYTPLAVLPASTFQLLQKSASSGNSHSPQLQLSMQHLQLQQTPKQSLASPYRDIPYTAFQWTVPEQHSSLVKSDSQLLYTDHSQKISGSNSVNDTTASAVMALALATNDRHTPHTPQLSGMGSSTFSTSFSELNGQQQPPLLQQLSSDGDHGMDIGKTIYDGNHNNGTDGDGDGESEVELSKSIEFYERIVQQQKMRLSLQRQFKSTTSGDFHQFRQQHG